MSSTTTTSGSRRPFRQGFAGLAVVIVAILCALPATAAAAKSHHRPPAPGAIKVLPLGQSRFHLSWPQVKHAAGYHVYNAGRLVGKVRRAGFTTAPLHRNGLHVYTVRSVSRRGVLSRFGRIVRIMVAPVSHDTTPPAVPRLRTMEAAPSSHAPQLTWAAVRDGGGSGVAGYRISRDGHHIASTSGTSFVDYAAESGVHVYTVSAYDRAGNVSGESAPQVAGRDTIAPATPAPSAESPTDSAPAISWDAVVDDESGVELYQIRRDGRTVGSTAGTSFTDDELSSAGWHTYAVRALDRAGNASAVVGPAGRALRAGRHRHHIARRAGLAGRLDRRQLGDGHLGRGVRRHRRDRLRRVRERRQGRHREIRDAARVRRGLWPRLHLRRGRIRRRGEPLRSGDRDGDHRRLSGGRHHAAQRSRRPAGVAEPPRRRR